MRQWGHIKARPPLQIAWDLFGGNGVSWSPRCLMCRGDQLYNYELELIRGQHLGR